MDLTEEENIKKKWQKHTELYQKNGLNSPDNHTEVITHTPLEGRPGPSKQGQAAGLANPGPPPPLQTKGPGPLSRRRRTENQPAQAQLPRDASPPSLRSPPGCWGL